MNKLAQPGQKEVDNVTLSLSVYHYRHNHGLLVNIKKYATLTLHETDHYMYLYSHLPTRELKLLLQSQCALPTFGSPVGAVLGGKNDTV